MSLQIAMIIRFLLLYCRKPPRCLIFVQTPGANLSRAMRHINGVYTQCYNRKRKTDGQLFRGRYKSVLVQEDSHLLELLRYIPNVANTCDSISLSAPDISDGRCQLKKLHQSPIRIKSMRISIY
jgi:hypothetical protein